MYIHICIPTSEFVCDVYSDLCSPLHMLSDVLKLVVSIQRIASHPELLQPADVLSPFHMDAIHYHIARLVDSIFDGSKCDVSHGICQCLRLSLMHVGIC